MARVTKKRNLLLDIAAIALVVCRRHLARYSCPKSKHDFTQAQLTSQVTVIKVRCIFGGIDITVPEGVVVQSSVRAVFGGHSSPSDVAPAGAPVIRIEGTAVFGGIDTHRPKNPKRRKWDRLG